MLTNTNRASLCIITILSLCLTACGGGGSGKERVKLSKPAMKQMIDRAKEKRGQLQAKAMDRKLRTAVILLIANIGNIQNGGGYQSWTATKMTDKVLKLSKSANAPSPGMPKAKRLGPEITYTKGKVSQSWQIVLIPNDRAKKIKIKAYGNSTKKPIIEREVHVSTY